MKILIYSIFLISFNFAQFNWGDDGAPIRQGIHIEWQRTGDADSDGSMIFAWSDCRNGVRDIVAQKVDINGNNLWGDNGVIVVSASGRQEDPQLVIDGFGGAYIIWMDYREETDSEGDIYAQHVLNDGTLAWGSNGRALVDKSGQQFSPNICSDGNGGAYVIWKDNQMSSYGDIYASHLSNQGIIAEGSGVPIITYSSYRSSPSLNTAGSGEAVLVWSDDRNQDNDLYAQRISMQNGTISTLWGEDGKLVCDANGDQSSPRVSHYGDEKTILVWEDPRNGAVDAYYQILDNEGEPELDINGLAACSGDFDIIKPRVKAENFVAYIVWEDRRDGWTSNIYAQKINSNGIVEWGNGLSISNAEQTQSQPRLTTDGLGGAYFIWEDHRNSGDTGIDIYAQHVNFNGQLTHSDDGEQICIAENLQFNPLVRNDGSGGALMVWGDQRTGGSYSINIQHMDQSGVTLQDNGKEAFFGIATDAANEPYEHGIVYLENDEALVYWQDNRYGDSKIYGSKVSSSYDNETEIFSNQDINGELLTSSSFAQENPKAILANDKIFLSFKVEESPNENLYFQLLNLDLTQDGSATALSSPSSAKLGFDMVYGIDGYIYYAFSEDYDIVLKKLSTNGQEIWTEPIVQTSEDDDVKAIYPLSGSGCIVIYESDSFFSGAHVYAIFVDGSGQVIVDPILLSDLEADQYYEHSLQTETGIFISFKENSNGNYDIYGQHLDYNGNLEFGSVGIEISSGPNDQQASSVTYNPNSNNVFICYENSDGTESDIYCNEIYLNSQTISESIVISSINYDQMNPNVVWSGDSYFIVWEDARNSSPNPELDIYFQEYKNNQFTYSSGGEELCSFPLKQENPIIARYSEDSFIIIWEDYRSTGKEFCANLYGQTISSCPDGGDLNADSIWNVLDIVTLANCVLAQNCSILENGCAGDLNQDGLWNVLDIVTLANCVLAQNCSGRVDDATRIDLKLNDEKMYFEADGFIGGIEMSLYHANDFNIKMTADALYSDYLTNENKTRLLVINPKSEILFDYNGSFIITEVIAANSQYEISASLPVIQNFILGDAYPNPFNPKTIMDFTLPIASEVNVQIYNVLGQSVAVLLEGYKKEGTYELVWDATSDASGMYFVKANVNGSHQVQKLMLLK